MYYLVYDASGELRFESHSWPMARSALDLVIQEAQEQDSSKDCPRLFIGSEEDILRQGDDCISRSEALRALRLGLDDAPLYIQATAMQCITEAPGIGPRKAGFDQ